jgi:ATP adenylyltransferase
MDFLWSPWRAKYVTAAQEKGDCIFCVLAGLAGPEADEASFVLFRGESNFIVLNLFPYLSGHLMIVPYSHVAALGDLEESAGREMMSLAGRAEKALTTEYRPDGLNLGMNLGQAAGAGVANHIHLHVLPRWIGDANFMTTVGETRVLSESLESTFHRLKKHF